MTEGKRAGARPLGARAETAFLAELATGGNVLRAAAAAEVGAWTAYRRRARDAGFAAAWDGAMAQAAARLAVARTARAAGAGAAGAERVRRQSGGRPQLTAVRAREWTAKAERDFLDHLSITANVRAAAEAAGVSASGA